MIKTQPLNNKENFFFHSLFNCKFHDEIDLNTKVVTSMSATLTPVSQDVEAAQLGKKIIPKAWFQLNKYIL